MLSVMEAITISLLIGDVKTQYFGAVNREAMEDALKALNIGSKVLTGRSNAMWNILLASEDFGRCSTHY